MYGLPIECGSQSKPKKIFVWLLLLALSTEDRSSNSLWYDNMAEEQAAEGIMNNPDNIIFVYTGEQDVPSDVTHVIIDRSVKIIPERAFLNRRKLVSVEMHDGVERIEERAFQGCISLRGIKLPGVVAVELGAFQLCTALTDVDFGDKLETIRYDAFNNCHSLQKIKMPSLRAIGLRAFSDCKQLTDVELPAVETIGEYAFLRCVSLQRIAIPLKNITFPPDPFTQRYNQFYYCQNLSTVDLVGGIHNTISSLLLESWRNEMLQEIDRINQVLPNTPANDKTDAIRMWIISVISRMEHYKAEHYALLKEDMTQLELALWKAKLDDKDEDHADLEVQAKKAKIDVESMRKERRITSGASIVIKNVLPFLKLG
jgi:hypothetical protein